MDGLPRRTGVTGLSDDELLLFDFLFDVGVENGSLRRQKYPVHMNVRYTHELDDFRLELTLCSLEERGLIQRELKTDLPYDGRILNRLTEAGGTLWELERRPIWDRYCGDTRWRALRNFEHIQLLRIESPSRSSCEQFLQSGIDTGYLKLAGRFPQVRRRRLIDRRLVPWKKFPEAHTIIAKVVSSPWQLGTQDMGEISEHHSAMKFFFDNSMLWSNVAELDRLHSKLDNQ